MNSVEILGLFAWLEENDQSLDLGLIRDVLQQNQEPVDSSHQKAIRDYTARSVGIRTTLDPDDDRNTLNLIWGTKLVDDEDLDDYFTRRTLADIPCFVQRVRKLATIERIDVPPSERIAKYFSQASGCFIHGFHAAVVVLSRAVLEFGLEERLAQKDLLGSTKRDEGYLKDLINWSGNCGILPRNLVAPAHEVRKRGNGAIHGAASTEKEAEETIGLTVKILTALYAEA